MDSKYFDLNKISKTLKFVLENKHSNFYKIKFGKNFVFRNIKTYEDFLKIPTLEKREIVLLDMKEKIFVEKKDVTNYSVSNGISNPPKALYLPHSLIDEKKYHKNAREILGKNRKIDTTLLLVPPYCLPVSVVNIQKIKDVAIILGDVTDLKLSALLAKEANIQAIGTTPGILSKFSEELKNVKFNFDGIKWITFYGESCGSLTLNNLKNIFPNANFEILYGNTENGQKEVGGRCIVEDNEGPNVYHLQEEFHFVEILDNEGKQVKNGVIGEIYTTNLDVPNAFPLIRYKMDDKGRILKRKCKHCGSRLLEITRDSNVEVLKFGGMTLYLESVLKAIEPLREVILAGPEVHVFEKKLNNKVVPKIVINISIENSGKDNEKTITDFISKRLYISKNKTYSDLVENSQAVPLEIKNINSKKIGKPTIKSFLN